MLQKYKDDCKPYQLIIGDDIWLKAKNLIVKGSHKLLPKRYRPFKILECIRQVAYCLKLPIGMKYMTSSILTSSCHTGRHHPIERIISDHP